MIAENKWFGLLVWLPFTIVAGWHLYGTLPHVSGIGPATKGLLMPLLGVLFLQLLRGSFRPLAFGLLGAILLSWLGDITLRNFIVGLSFFLLAQLTYAVVFFKAPGRLRWPAALVFVFAGGLAALLMPSAGALAVPILLYALAIALMAFAAARVNGITFLGACLFVVSDAVLALNKFMPELGIPYASFVVMSTYLAGQALIAAGCAVWLGRKGTPGQTE